MPTTEWGFDSGDSEHKAAAGLDVRVMYDDFGSMGRLLGLSTKYQVKGIRCMF